MVLDDKPIANADVRHRFVRYVAATRALEYVVSDTLMMYIVGSGLCVGIYMYRNG